jgi:hypothetical protein
MIFFMDADTISLEGTGAEHAQRESSQRSKHILERNVIMDSGIIYQ